MVSLVCIYLFFLSRGQNPTSNPNGIKLTLQTFGFPLASPLLSGFSIDDLLHGLIYHTGKPVFDAGWSMLILGLLAALSPLLILNILRRAPNKNYRLFVIAFYLTAILVFGITYLRQFSISYEARHFRMIGLLIVPGMVYMISKFKPVQQWFFVFIGIGIGFTSLGYLIKGYRFNENTSARGITGIAQPNIDQKSLDQVMKLDRENK